MKRLLLLTLAACTTGKPNLQVEAPTNTQIQEPAPQLKTISDYAKETYPVKGWDSRYSEVIKLVNKEFPVKAPCELELFLKAIINAESGFNNKSYYLEPAPLNVNSIGFFQLSLQDAKNYGIKDMFVTEKDFENPVKNIYAAMLIMNRLQTKHPTENVWESLGRYWSCLRDDRWPKWAGKNQSGFNRVRTYLEKYGCVIN